MKNNKTIKKVSTALALTLTVCVVSALLYTQHLYSESINENIELQDDIKNKSTEIANLEVFIEDKDNDLNAKTEVIDEQELQINEQKDSIDTLVSQVEQLESELVSEKEKSSQLQLELEKQEVAEVNFKIDDEGSVVDAIDIVETEAQVASGRQINAEMTAYIGMCAEGCTGVTATGVDVRDTIYYEGRRIIATDPNVIPMHSIVSVELNNGEVFEAVSLDTGGAINGNIVDFLVGSTDEALNFGRQSATITVLREGK